MMFDFCFEGPEELSTCQDIIFAMPQSLQQAKLWSHLEPAHKLLLNDQKPPEFSASAHYMPLSNRDLKVLRL